MFNFQKLEVWQLSKSLTLKIYEKTDSFPEIEKFGLIIQLRRASISISSNIAEGSSRYSTLEKKRFYNIAFSSTLEVISQLIISYELKFIKEEEYEELSELIELILKKISALVNSLNLKD